MDATAAIEIGRVELPRVRGNVLRNKASPGGLVQMSGTRFG